MPRLLAHHEQAISYAARIWEKTTSDPIALFTLALVIVSSLQLYSLKQSNKAAMIAANAAELSARAAVRMELPWIGFSRPELVGLSGPLPQRGAFAGAAIYEIPTGYLTIMGLKLNNVGRTPARLSGAQAGWFIGDKLDPKPKYLIHRNLGGEVVREGGHVADIEISRFTIEIDNEEAIKIRDGQFQFWFFVQVFYSDFLGDVHHQTFCWKWAREHGYAGYCFVRDKYCPPAYADQSIRSPGASSQFDV